MRRPCRPRGPAVRRQRPGGRRGLTAIVIAFGLAALWGFAPQVRRVRVDGGSMAPALLPGDRLLVTCPSPVARRRGGGIALRVGQVAVVRDPRAPDRVLVKRVRSVDGASGAIEVRGDDPGASTDSRTFGPVPAGLVIGRARYRYAPPARVGRGPWHGYAPD